MASGAAHVHCADGDRLLRWVETRPEELAAAVAAVRRSECLILARSERAFGTHPRALRETEAIVNAVGGHLLGQPMDLGGGSRGFGRAAAEAVLRHAAPDDFGDLAWPVLARRAGFRVDILTVAGPDWETADHPHASAADARRQRDLAEAHDRDP